jgi:hypothetical protein
MQVFGVDLDIDGAERKRLQSAAWITERRPRAEAVATMQTFGVHLDIDGRGQERQRRQSRGDPQSPPTRSDEARVASFAGDIEGVSKRRHFPDASHAGTALVSDEPLDLNARKGQGCDSFASARSWGLPAESSSKASRRKHFEHTFRAEQWAELMDRPRRGNPNAVWTTEARFDMEQLDDVPVDARAILQELKRGLQYEPANARRRSSSARPPTKLTETLRTLQNGGCLHDISQCPLEYVEEEGKIQDDSDASTTSGDAQTFDVAASPEVMSTSPGSATPEIADSDSECGMYHLVHDPKGKHTSLRSKDNDEVATYCKPLHFPIGFRRVMAAVLPADPDTSLQLSLSQMQKLSGLRQALQAQKQQAPPPRRAARNNQRPAWQSMGSWARSHACTCL